MNRAVVLGGGLAGVLVATVLARHADVVVVEGGRYPAAPGPRSGLPQGYHNHVLVAGGARALDELLPGTVPALLDRGAHRRDLSGGALIRSVDGWFHRYETGAYLLSCSRWLTDHVVRERAAVPVLQDTRALGLAGDAERVTGAVVARADGRVETLHADLVVDATGRRSRAPRWLAALGAGPVEEETVDSGLAYATRMYRAPARLAGTIPAVMVHPRPANGHPGHGATVFPIEDGRWMVTLTGTRGAAPPVDGAGFAACAAGLSSPIVAELMAAASPVSDVRPYRATVNRRRFFERGPRPAGFLVMGDALVAVNPFYSHGMSIAALSALRLAEELADGLGVAAPRLQAAVAAVAEPSWRMAAGTDRNLVATRAAQTGMVPSGAALNGAAPSGAAPSGAGQGGAGQGGAARSGARAGGGGGLRMSRAVTGNRALMTAMFRAQALLPPDRTAGAPPLAGSATAAPLTDDEAIAQYPELSAWWRSVTRDPIGTPA